MVPLFFINKDLRSVKSNETALNRKTLAAAGIADLLDDVELRRGAAAWGSTGPDGLDGTIVSAWADDALKVDVNTDITEIEWTPLHAGGNSLQAWVGLSPLDLPTPADLLRRKPKLTGPSYTLDLSGDRGQISVPVYLRPNMDEADAWCDRDRDEIGLPTYIWMDGDQTKSKIRQQYFEVWNQARDMASAIFSGDESKTIGRKAWDYAVKALSWNYRIRNDLIGPLQLIGGMDDINLITCMTVDAPFYWEMRKQFERDNQAADATSGVRSRLSQVGKPESAALDEKSTTEPGYVDSISSTVPVGAS